VHGIPDEFDPAIFVGATLATVTFGPRQVQLNFDHLDEEGRAIRSIPVSVEGAYEHRGPGGGWLDAGSVPHPQSRLVQLTNHTVVSAVVESRERLRLAFDHDQTLTLIDTGPEYESFNIWEDGRVWII
jgi:hypothetical protein